MYTPNIRNSNGPPPNQQQIVWWTRLIPDWLSLEHSFPSALLSSPPMLLCEAPLPVGRPLPPSRYPPIGRTFSNVMCAPIPFHRHETLTPKQNYYCVCFMNVIYFTRTAPALLPIQGSTWTLQTCAYIKIQHLIGVVKFTDAFRLKLWLTEAMVPLLLLLLLPISVRAAE